MRLLELAKAFQAGKLQKWIYWRLVREKMKILTELQEVLVWNSAAERIEIRTDGIVFVHARGGGADGCRCYLAFEETISRADAEVSRRGD